MKATIERSILLTAGAAAVASVVLATSAWRAVTIGEAETEPPALAASNEAMELPKYRALPAEAVQLIAENEPFREQRRPSSEPYRLPGDRLPEVVVREAPPPPEPPSFVVVGTVVTADGGLAVIQTAEGLPPVFVGVNQNVEGFRLVSVATSGATLRRDDQTFQLAVADPAILREQPSQTRGRNTNSRQQQQQQQQRERQAVQQQTERLRGLMEQAAAQGGTISIQGLPPGMQEMAGQALEMLPQIIRERVQQGGQGEPTVIIRRQGVRAPQ